MEKYLLIIGIAILAFILYRKFTVTTDENIKNVNAQEAYELLEKNKNVIVIDVRTKQEYSSGHIPGSKSIPVGEILSRISEIEKYKDSPVLIHCASGSRSASAVRILSKNKFNNIYHMNRGLVGWKYKLK